MIHAECGRTSFRGPPQTVRYDEFKRALCLLDPYGLHLDWNVMEIAGQLGTIDLLLNFPIMDMNRNALLWKPESADADDIARIRTCSVMSNNRKQPNKAVAAAFRERLKKAAGFDYVAEPLPMTNKKNAVVYYLFFASKKPVADNIIKSIFNAARSGAYRGG